MARTTRTPNVDTVRVVIEFPDRTPKISTEEWAAFIKLAADLREAEGILKGLRAAYRRREATIISKLGEGATIENAGKLALNSPAREVKRLK